jgi:hypothetical protein
MKKCMVFFTSVTEKFDFLIELILLLTQLIDLDAFINKSAGTNNFLN